MHFFFCSYMSSPVVDQLINVESDENMDEDVFAEDQEVCDVMRGAAGHSPLPHDASPLNPPQAHHHCNTSRGQVLKFLYKTMKIFHYSCNVFLSL